MSTTCEDYAQLVRHQPGRGVTARLVSALVLSSLDYCNAVFVGLPATALAPFQTVLHATARLVLELRPRDHVSTALKVMHWLPVRQRIDYKLCMLENKLSIVHAPAYLTSMLTPCVDVSTKAALRSHNSDDYVVPRTNLKFGE